ncbi:MAG: hypothetical protein AB2392_22430 [Neobacillus sp.]
MKFRMLLLVIGLFFFLPGMNIADAALKPNPDVKQGEKNAEECDCEEREHSHKDWKAKMEEREKNLLAWVDQYTPDKKDEWTKVIAEKKDLRAKWLAPEFSEKREKWKQEKMAKIQDLKKQLEEGKITKEQFVEKAHGSKSLAQWKTFHELKAAAEAKDDKKAATLLNQLLDQQKQHNQKMKDMMK